MRRPPIYYKIRNENSSLKRKMGACIQAGLDLNDLELPVNCWLLHKKIVVMNGIPS